MKATILADGTLEIAPETGIEAYALDKWCRANLDYRNVVDPKPKMLVDLSEFPGALQPIPVPA